MRTLRYGVDETWAFNGFNLAPNEAVIEAYLTIKDSWATATEEQGAEPPRLQLAITSAPSVDGQILEANDGNGNWSLVFFLTVTQTSESLEPAPRFLWYEVTLKTAQVAP